MSGAAATRACPPHNRVATGVGETVVTHPTAATETRPSLSVSCRLVLLKPRRRHRLEASHARKPSLPPFFLARRMRPWRTLPSAPMLLQNSVMTWRRGHRHVGVSVTDKRVLQAGVCWPRSARSGREPPSSTGACAGRVQGRASLGGRERGAPPGSGSQAVLCVRLAASARRECPAAGCGARSVPWGFRNHYSGVDSRSAPRLAAQTRWQAHASGRPRPTTCSPSEKPARVCLRPSAGRASRGRAFSHSPASAARWPSPGTG